MGSGGMGPKNLVGIFSGLRAKLKRYEGKLKPKVDLGSRYDLWSFKAVTIAGRPRKETYFAGLAIQSSYVGFYFMPVYADVSLKNVFGPDLLKTLKGKSCFHMTKLTPELGLQVDRALEIEYGLYEKRGWV